ncbi:MAG: PAS domain S-box protein, partial [Desulfohalobiaceae bacterium]|nr:PAS domain S-box protein [Desulfohalobiaceae bacterium]
MKTSVTTRFAGRGPAEIFAASLVAFACLAGLVCLGLLNYLLFHSLVELGAVAVAWSVFLLTWNTRRLHVPSGFLVLGLAYACVGSLDLLHTLAYEGMGIFVDSGSNLATQLWLSARYIESAALLIFPFVFGRRIPPWAVTIFLTGISTLLLGAIFFWGIFPVCFDPETGLTAFKKASEYAVMGVLALAGTFIRRRRFSIGTRIAPLLLAATGMTILSEFSFTLYAHPYGLANMAGHLCKVISFFFIYRALIVQSLQEPLETLARDLRRESERYTRIVQTAIDGFWLLDVQGRICETNTAAAGMLGYSQEELNRLSIRDIDVQESPEETSRHLARIAAQGYDRFETLHRRKDGEILQVEASCRYLEQEGEWFIVFFRDVSARKQAEARLRLQARLLDQVSDAVIATDLALRITAWNAAAERIYGWTEAEALGEPIDELLGTRWLDVSLSRARAELEAKGAWKGDVQQRHKEGHRLMIEASVSWTYDVYGSRSGGVCVNRDVTRRKQTEEALRHSEHRYRSFIEHATEGIYMLALGDPIAVNLTVEEQVEALYDRAYLAECNDAFARMYGLDSGSQLLGKRLEDFHGGRDHPVNRAEARKFIESGYQIANEETLEADLNGEERWFANTTVGIVEKGCLQSMWGTQTDITERKQASIALAASESRHRSIVAALPDLLFRVDQDLQITEVQTKVPEMLLAPVDQLIGKSLREILPQPAADLNCRKALAALQNGEMQVFEYALDMQYGQRECETRMLACGQNEVQALVRDITERKDLE